MLRDSLLFVEKNNLNADFADYAEKVEGRKSS
jgi:hypothetical protein